MQLFADIADPVDQICLHEAVDILILCRNCKRSVFHVTQNAFQAFQDLIPLLLRQNLLLCKHLHMCHAAFDILLIQPLVKCDRRIEIIYHLVGFLRETTAP